jgi:hypothetical protein
MKNEKHRINEEIVDAALAGGSIGAAERKKMKCRRGRSSKRGC